MHFIYPHKIQVFIIQNGARDEMLNNLKNVRRKNKINQYFKWERIKDIAWIVVYRSDLYDLMRHALQNTKMYSFPLALGINKACTHLRIVNSYSLILVFFIFSCVFSFSFPFSAIHFLSSIHFYFFQFF